jgi:hemerythrin
MLSQNGTPADMPLLEWDARYSVNIRDLDRQHQKLFDLINRLHDAIGEGRGKEVMGAILEELLDYTRYHFATEERLFAQHDYPGMAQHIGEHHALTAEAKDFKRRFDAHDGVDTSQLLGFLKSWLYHHINGADKLYASYLNERGVR